MTECAPASNTSPVTFNQKETAMKIKGTDQYGLPYTTEDVKFLITIGVIGAVVFVGALFLVAH